MEPKTETNKNRRGLSVLPRTQVSGEPVPSDDRSQVFPEGFNVGESKGDNSEPTATPTFWGGFQVEGPALVRQGSHDYWLWKVWGKAADAPRRRRE